MYILVEVFYIKDGLTKGTVKCFIKKKAKKMKLIFCKECTDVVRLTTAMVKSCDCGKSSGQYVDHINAWYKGPCMPLGFNNASFSKVLKNPPLTGWGKPFDAFVIEKDCPTFKNQNKEDEKRN